MGITPRQLLGLDYAWRGAPRVRLASPSLDTLALDLTWRGAPLVADALEPEPVSLWASPLLELAGAAEAQVVQSMWGAGVVSLFGATASLSADAYASTSCALWAEVGLEVSAVALVRFLLESLAAEYVATWKPRITSAPSGYDARQAARPSTWTARGTVDGLEVQATFVRTDKKIVAHVRRA